MAVVPLDFTPPAEPDIVELKIYESPTIDGLYSPIETVTAIGAYPDYISRYTTDQATSLNSWFAIQWIDDKGAESDLSQPVQGGTTLLIGKIVNRVLQRDPSLDEIVVTQEAEAVIEQYFGVDPYDPTLTASYRIMSGLTYMILARSMLASIVQASASSTSSFTAGLISVKSGTDTKSVKEDIQGLLELAMNMLGLSQSRVAQMALPEIAQGQVILSADLSRTIIDVG